jgi:hypothetical protein
MFYNNESINSVICVIKNVLSAGKKYNIYIC